MGGEENIKLWAERRSKVIITISESKHIREQASIDREFSVTPGHWDSDLKLFQFAKWYNCSPAWFGCLGWSRERAGSWKQPDTGFTRKVKDGKYGKSWGCLSGIIIINGAQDLDQSKRKVKKWRKELDQLAVGLNEVQELCRYLGRDVENLKIVVWK